MATAAPITTYSDREFLFRLQTLVIDGGTEVLRNIFDQRLQNQPLNVVLASQRSTINRLRRQNTLTRVQYDCLYPRSGQLPTSSDFDITLIVCLLRNLPCLGCNQNYNWNVPPQTGDTSVEADVCRLRVFRNEIAHISSTTGFQQSSFEAKWREIETVLLRLDQNSPNPNFSQTIDSYKYGPMDPANERKIRTMIEQWQERDRGLETDMQLIRKYFSATQEDVERIKEDVIYLRQAMPRQEETEKAAEKAYVEMKSKSDGKCISGIGTVGFRVFTIMPPYYLNRIKLFSSSKHRLPVYLRNPDGTIVITRWNDDKNEMVPEIQGHGRREKTGILGSISKFFGRKGVQKCKHV